MKYYTTREVGKILGYSTNALYKLRAAGKGPPYIKLENGTIRYSQEEIVKWIKEHH